MHKQITNILICGVTRSGSSAVLDLLREYDNIGMFPEELDDFRAPGMIADQLDEELSSDWPNMIDQKVKLKGLRSKFYNIVFSSPIFLENGRLNYLTRNNKIDRQVKNKNYRRELLALNKTLKSEVSLEQKILATTQWVSALREIYCSEQPEKDYFIFDQPVTVITKAKVWKQVFKPFKMICSIRNPKDQIADIISDRTLFKPYGAPKQNWGGNFLESLHGRDRISAIKMFIRDIKIKYEIINQRLETLSNDQFLLVSFESLVKDYDRMVKIIEEFLPGIKGHHANVKKYFNPEVSAKNISLFSEYIGENEEGLIDGLQLKYEHLIEKAFVRLGQ